MECNGQPDLLDVLLAATGHLVVFLYHFFLFGKNWKKKNDFMTQELPKWNVGQAGTQ